MTRKLSPKGSYLELFIPGARSLTWQGDVLLDWLGGLRAYALDGSSTPRRVSFAYRFDSVAQSPSGEYTVLYERLGTKGIVLRGERMLREINRSFYHANVYDFPLALFRLPDGREALAHCPDHYNELEIELLETGERLTSRLPDGPQAADFFHSGLAASPSGEWLASAGWIWHPVHAVNLYRVPEALREPASLDRGPEWIGGVEVHSAVFLPSGKLALAANQDADDFGDEDEPEPRLRPGSLGVYNPEAEQWEIVFPLDEHPGRLVAVDEEHVLALYQHPRLIHLATGQVLERWPDIDTGTWSGCISWSGSRVVPFAWDPAGKRLAVAAPERIQLLSFG